MRYIIDTEAAPSSLEEYRHVQSNMSSPIIPVPSSLALLPSTEQARAPNKQAPPSPSEKSNRLLHLTLHLPNLGLFLRVIIIITTIIMQNLPTYICRVS